MYVLLYIYYVGFRTVLGRIVKFDRIPNTEYIWILKLLGISFNYDHCLFFRYQTFFFLQSGIFDQTFNFDFEILYLLFNYSALTIQIIGILFGIQKMNEYEYRIALFGPNYSNIRIICPNTDLETLS